MAHMTSLLLSPPSPPFQIVYHSKKTGFVILYVTATDSAECSDWVATLRQGERGAELKHQMSLCLYEVTS